MFIFIGGSFTLQTPSMHIFGGTDPRPLGNRRAGPTAPTFRLKYPKNAPVRLQFYTQTELGLRCLILQMTRLKTSSVRQKIILRSPGPLEKNNNK